MIKLAQYEKKKVLEICREQSKIFAVKYVKDITGLGVRESKEIVGEIIDTHDKPDIFAYLVKMDSNFNYVNGVIIVNVNYNSNINLIKSFCEVSGIEYHNVGNGLLYITL